MEEMVAYGVVAFQNVVQTFRVVHEAFQMVDMVFFHMVFHMVLLDMVLLGKVLFHMVLWDMVL